MESTLSFIWMMVQTIIALTVVCGLAYLLFRVVLPKLSFTGSANSMVKIVDRIPIDARKSLCVIEVAGKWMLIAVSESGVQLVSELNSEAAALAELEISKKREANAGGFIASGVTDKFTEIFTKKREGK